MTVLNKLNWQEYTREEIIRGMRDKIVSKSRETKIYSYRTGS